MKNSRDLAIPAGGFATLHPRESVFLAGNLGAANAEVVIPADGCSTVALLVTGTYVGTLTVEGSIDGVNWDTVPIKPVNAGGTWALTLASAAVGRWHGPVGPFRVVRVRMSAYTSGVAAVVLCAENGIVDVVMTPKAADQGVTNTGAAGAAVTLTLPAAGAGLYHFIDRVILTRFATAVLTAGATPVIGTSTNLPGSRAFSFPAEAAAQGTLYSEIIEPAVPIRSSAPNTATTIVLPVTTGVLWRATADYHIGSHG